jgi:hypothetical protein
LRERVDVVELWIQHLHVTLNDVIRRQVSAINGAVNLTKVTLIRPARVCPKRNDMSHVVSRKGEELHLVSNSDRVKGRPIHTLARGIMARNETIDGLEGG